MAVSVGSSCSVDIALSLLGQADWPATGAVLALVVFGSFNIPADIIASGWWLNKEDSLLGGVEGGVEKASGVPIRGSKEDVLGVIIPDGWDGIAFLLVVNGLGESAVVVPVSFGCLTEADKGENNLISAAPAPAPARGCCGGLS